MLTTPLRAIGTYGMACTAGSLCGLFVHKHYRHTKLLQINHYDRYLREIAKGRLIIASNHPSLLEPMILLGMCWPQVLWRPVTYFPWNTPDAGVFGKREWLYEYSNSIKISRHKTPPDQRRNEAAVKMITTVLNTQRTVIMFPEGGCTGSRNKDGSQPELLCTRTAAGTRHIRPITGGIPQLALETGARILPVYVDMPFWERVRELPNRFSDTRKLWMAERETVTIHVGRSYYPNKQSSKVAQNQELTERILHT